MLQDFYKKKVVPQLMKELHIDNVMRVPRLTKIVVNSCLSEAVSDPKVLEVAGREIAMITGQKPSVRKAKKSISAFKLREGIPIAVRVTLRKKRMYEFFNRLVNVALPRSRDFKGLPLQGFDGHGNYNFGIGEQIIFPEIASDKVDKPRGMNMSLVTTACRDKEGIALLRALGLPLMSEKKEKQDGKNIIKSQSPAKAKI